jgi:predicted peptidase
MAFRSERRLLCCFRLALLTALLIPPCIAFAADTPRDTGFINGTAELNGRKMLYVVYVPRNYSPDKQWPVVLFLHGAGEVGSDGLRQVTVGIGPQLFLNPQRFPCLVVMPQASGQSWSGTLNDLARRALDDVVARYNGDPNRLYLTGLSLGGTGTWTMASQHPERFAAIIPICGCGSPASASRLTSLPIWVFHGGADPVVPVQCSRQMVAALKAAGNPNVQYTEYAGVGHNAWDQTYSNPQVIAWLLAQKR